MRCLTIHAMLTLLLSTQPRPGLGDDGISVFEPVRTRSHTKVIRSSQVEYSINVLFERSHQFGPTTYALLSVEKYLINRLGQTMGEV